MQNLLGLSDRAQRDRRTGEDSASVALELQADCFAGVWGHAASQRGRAAAGKVELDPGDVEEGLQAAASIGDDRLQRMSRGRVSPESFTHGSSAQRVEWFRRGLQSGDPGACDTFAARRSSPAVKRVFETVHQRLQAGFDDVVVDADRAPLA